MSAMTTYGARTEAANQLYDEARRFLEAGSRDAAMKLFRDSLEAFPHFKSAELLSECLLESGNPAEAAVYAAAAIGLGRRQTRARFLLARALIQLGEVDDAREKLVEALDLNPHYKAARELHDSLEGHRSLRP